MGLIVSEQWLQGTARGEFSGGFPWDGHQCHSGLNPERFSVSWALLAASYKESYSSPVSCLQAQSESCSPVAAQGEDNQTGDSHLQSYRSEAIKPNTEKKIRREYSRNYVRLGALVFTNG